nr:PREDICTED: insulinoma-associated protein 1a-like [Bemisia tabaci]
MEGFYSSFLHRYPLPSLLVDRYHPFIYYEPEPPPLDLSVKNREASPSPPATSPKKPARPATPTTPDKKPVCSPAVWKSAARSPLCSPVSNSSPVPSSPAARSPGSRTPAKRQKAVRKLNFDEDKVSPVSGTIIRSLDESESVVVRKGDIDPIFNVVEVTEEAKAELAKIENKIGDYICRLCRITFEDAFSLAQHRCSCIVHVEYRCPECDKVFNCPANLASHRRWHKPKDAAQTTQVSLHTSDESEEEAKIPCPVCGKLFRRQSYLRKHLVSHTHTHAHAHTHTVTSPPMMGLSHLAVAN